jgi:hypothetical protein
MCVMPEKKVVCPQCSAALILDSDPAAEKARCPDCKAVFAVPRDPPPPKSASFPRSARRAPRPRRSSGGSGISITLLAIGSIALLILVVVGIFAVMAFRGKGGSPLAAGGGMFSPSGLGINPLATKANFDKLDEGMTLEEVQSIVGPGKAADESDMEVAFGKGWARDDPRGPPAQQWTKNGRQAGVTSWYQWCNGDFSIFVGFAKGKRSGKDKALLGFWVERLDRGVKPIDYIEGFRSDVGFTANGDPDKVTDAHDAENRRLNDPKWKKGNPRQLILGRWRDSLACGYEFGANGLLKSFGLDEYISTYRFIDDDNIEINVPAATLKPARMERYRVLVAQNELVLVRQDGHRRVFMEYQRVR